MVRHARTKTSSRRLPHNQSGTFCQPLHSLAVTNPHVLVSIPSTIMTLISVPLSPRTTEVNLPRSNECFDPFFQIHTLDN